MGSTSNVAVVIRCFCLKWPFWLQVHILVPSRLRALYEQRPCSPQPSTPLRTTMPSQPSFARLVVFARGVAHGLSLAGWTNATIADALKKTDGTPPLPTLSGSRPPLPCSA